MLSDAEHFLLGLPPEGSADPAEGPTDPAEPSDPDTGLPATVLSDGMRSELERQNEALRYSQQVAEGALERFATLFSNVPLALMVVDEDSLVLESNAMALEHFRPQETDPPLNFLLPLVLPEHQARVKTAFVEAKQGGKSEAHAVEFLAGVSARLNGNLHIARIDNPNDDLANFICAVIDRGPLLAQMAQKDALEGQLRESQKMQAVGTLAGGIAHDFNNILAAILGNVELARQDAKTTSIAANAAVQTSLQEIDKAARRARDLVHQILTFSRKEPLKLAPLQLADVVQDSLALIKLGLPPHITLQVDAPTPLPLVMADATQAAQALLNLCTNAVQAMGTERGSLLLRLRPAESQVQLTVQDTGPGMDEATLERVFEPFFTTKPVGQGTGLGLAVVHGILRAHGGTVSVQSQVGAGSSFTLSFQLAAPATSKVGPSEAGLSASAAGGMPQQVVQTAGQGQHIVVIDDDQALVFLLERALARAGYRVSSFTDPQAACSYLEANAPKVHLVLTDHNMPGFSGIDVLHRLQPLGPGLRVAMTSGYITPEIEAAALAAGALALIPKPGSASDIVQAVGRLLEDPPSP